MGLRHDDWNCEFRCHEIRRPEQKGSPWLGYKIVLSCATTVVVLVYFDKIAAWLSGMF